MNKRILSLTLALIMILGTFTAVFAKEETVLGKKEAKFLEKEGILIGDESGNLLLDENLERRDAVILLSRLLKVEEEAKAQEFNEEIPSWSDVRIDDYYMPFLAWAEMNEYFEGNDDGTFGPRNPIKIEEYALVLLRALGHEVKGHDSWKKALSKAKKEGLLKDVTIKSGEEVLRGEMAVMTLNALGQKMFDSEQTLAEFLDIKLPEPPKVEKEKEEIHTDNSTGITPNWTNNESGSQDKTEDKAEETVEDTAPVIISPLSMKTINYDREKEVIRDKDIVRVNGAELVLTFDKEDLKGYIDNEGNIVNKKDLEKHFVLYEKDVSNIGKRAAEEVEYTAKVEKDKVTLVFNNIILQNKNKDYDYILEVRNFEDKAGNKMEKTYINFQVMEDGRDFDLLTFSENGIDEEDQIFIEYDIKSKSVEVKLQFNQYVNYEAAENVQNYSFIKRGRTTLADDALVERDGYSIALIFYNISKEDIEAYEMLEISPLITNQAGYPVKGSRFIDLKTGKRMEVDVENPSITGVANVRTFDELKKAVEDKSIKIINIENDIVVREKLNIKSEKHINGNNKTLRVFGKDKDWEGFYILHFYVTEGSVKDIKLSGADAGIYVNGSKVDLIGTIDLSWNKFGGIEVSKGKNVEKKPLLNITRSKLINTRESPYNPTIWEDDIGDINAKERVIGFVEKDMRVDYNESTIDSNFDFKNVNLQRYYFLDNNYNAPNQTGLRGALHKAFSYSGFEDFNCSGFSIATDVPPARTMSASGGYKHIRNKEIVWSEILEEKEGFIARDLDTYLGNLYYFDNGETVNKIIFIGDEYVWDGDSKGSNWNFDDKKLVDAIKAEYRTIEINESPSLSRKGLNIWDYSDGGILTYYTDLTLKGANEDLEYIFLGFQIGIYDE